MDILNIKCQLMHNVITDKSVLTEKNVRRQMTVNFSATLENYKTTFEKSFHTIVRHLVILILPGGQCPDQALLSQCHSIKCHATGFQNSERISISHSWTVAAESLQQGSCRLASKAFASAPSSRKPSPLLLL
ncbi:hypothetical protein TNCV_1106351 [Trichonephila clavipes]|nr:hypothetical protein TNCV_1106351 [Trichonephila clavipes]